VVVAFFICWAPFHAQRLLAIYGKHTSAGMIRAFQILTYVSGVFYYLSTTVNPLLYHILSHKFREAFKVRCATISGHRSHTHPTLNTIFREGAFFFDASSPTENANEPMPEFE
jgi:hypothetical protein